MTGGRSFSVWHVMLSVILSVWVGLAGIAFAQADADVRRLDLEPQTPILGAAWAAAGGEPFRFAIIGDKTGASPGDWPLFDLTLNEVNKWRPDFAVMVGDMVEGDSTDPVRIDEQWREFLGHVQALEVPLFIIPGNHDIPNPPALADWHERHGRSYYSFVYRDCLFIMLNAMEHWKDNGASLGETQTGYALDVLKRHPNPRHTFIFIHVPHWQGSAHAEWLRIEEGLRVRPHTVIAGHIHRNSYEERNGGQYVTVAASKGAAPFAEAPQAPEFGAFPAWAQVSVSDGRAEVTLVEPGSPRTWPASVAPVSCSRALRDLVSADAVLPEKTEDGLLKTGYVTTVNNGLPAEVSVRLTVQHPGNDAWKPISNSDADAVIEVGPGQKRSIAQRFLVPETSLTPAPMIQTQITYKGLALDGQNVRNIPVFPRDAMRWPAEWMALAPPYDAGPISSAPPADPRKDWPLLFVSHAAEKGYRASESINEEGVSRTWKVIPVVIEDDSAFVNMGVLSELPVKVFSYASIYVYSPSARTAYVRFRVDDFGQMFVNGKPINDGQIFRTRRDPVFVAVPLDKGWNNVCVKAINNGGGWTFHCLFADPDKELRFANAPE